MKFRFGLVWSLAILLSLSLGWANQPLPEESPFLPKGEAARSTAVRENAAFTFVGAVDQGTTTLISIHRSTDRHSVWIPIGSTINGITAQSYDPVLEQAVIVADGRAHTLQLRRPTAASRSRAPEPTGRPRRDAMEPVDSDEEEDFSDDSDPDDAEEEHDVAEPDDSDDEASEVEEQDDTEDSSDEEDAADTDDASDDEEDTDDPDLTAEDEEEYEARMLVSDLLDIGQRQRAAYQAARRDAQRRGINVNDQPTGVDYSNSVDDADDDDSSFDDADIDEGPDDE